MHKLIFQRLNSDERIKSINRLISESVTPVIVFSPNAKRLARSFDSTNKTVYPTVQLLIGEPDESDSFNPLDILDLLPQHLYEAVLPTILDPLVSTSSFYETGTKSSVANFRFEPSWRILASRLFAAVVACYVKRHKGNNALIEALNHFVSGNIAKNLAVLLENEGKLIRTSDYAVIEVFLNQSQSHQSTIIGMILGDIACLNIAPVQQVIEATTFDLNTLIDTGIDVFVEVPWFNSESSEKLLQIWLASFIQLMNHSSKPAIPFLFVIEPPGNMSLFSQIYSAQKVQRSPISIAVLLQNVFQIKVRYPEEWSAFIANMDKAYCVGPQFQLDSVELELIYGNSVAALCNIKPSDVFELGQLSAGETSYGNIQASAKLNVENNVAIFSPAYANKWDIIAPSFLNSNVKSAIIIESGGEFYDLTAESRSKNGNIVLIDPFNITGNHSDHFNPLDILKINGTATNLYQISAELNNLISTPSIESFWDNGAISLIRGALQYIFSVPEKKKTFSELWRIFNTDDVIYNLAVVLDTIGGKIPKDCYRDIAAFLAHSDSLRDMILQEVNKILIIFSSETVQKVTDETTFDIGKIYRESFTIYIEVPTQFLKLYGPLVRLWLSAFMHLNSLSNNDKDRVLYVVDQCAELNVFPQLQLIQKESRQFINMWTFWESPSQLSEKYPADWSAFLGNLDNIYEYASANNHTFIELNAIFGAPLSDLKAESGVDALHLSNKEENRNLNNDYKPIFEIQTGNRISFAVSPTDKWNEVSNSLLRKPVGLSVVFESASQCYNRTAEQQKKNGRVIFIDPFSTVNSNGDHFNPFDLLNWDSSENLAVNSYMLSAMLFPEEPLGVDPFWRTSALSLIHGVLMYLQVTPKKECNVVELRNTISSDDVVYNLAVVLDTEGKELPKECYALIATFLQKADLERSSILAVIINALRIFDNPLVAGKVAKSSFDISELTDINAITIYFEVPLHLLTQHAVLIQLWFASLIRVCDLKHGLTSQFIFDDPFSDLLFPLIKLAQKSRNTDIWTFWESVDQLRNGRTGEWSGFLGNAQTIEALGAQSRVNANEIATLFDRSKVDLYALKTGESILL